MTPSERVLRYLCDDLSSSERQKFEADLANDPVLAHQTAEALWQEMLLAELASERTRDAGFPVIRFPVSRWKPMAMRYALAASVMLGLFVGLWAVTRNVLVPAPWLIVENSGQVFRNGELAPIGRPVTLKRNDRIDVQSGSARITYRRESTTLRLGANATCKLLDRAGKEWFLNRGSLQATVAPQTDGKSLNFSTKEARATIVGTSFELVAAPLATWLQVDEGRVAFSRPDRSSQVVVAAGQCATGVPGRIFDPVDSARMRSPRAFPIRVPLFSQFLQPGSSWSVTPERLDQSDPSDSSQYVFPIPEVQSAFQASVTVQARALSSQAAAKLAFGFKTDEKRSYDLWLTRQAHSTKWELVLMDQSFQVLAREPLSINGELPTRLEISQEPLSSGETQIRGKCWQADSAEPEQWTVSTAPLKISPFKSLVIQTRGCAGSFSGIRAELVR